MTLSTSHLVDAGNTRLVVLLITINRNPSASSLRRGRASSLMRGSALRRLSEALRLGLGGDTSSRVQRGAGSGPARIVQCEMILKSISFPMQDDPEIGILPRCEVDADSDEEYGSADAGSD